MTEDRHIEFMWKGPPYWESQLCALKYRDSDHSYRIKVGDGPWDRYVNNSTVAKVAYNDPGGLMMHARKHALAGADHRDALKFSQECGTAAHDQLEALATTGKALDLSEQPERVRGALQAIAKWWLDLSPKFKASEVIVCSPTLRVAGRFDFLAEIGGELVLGDLKTSEKDWSHFRRFKAAASYAQLAGYSICYWEMWPDSPQPAKRAILHVSTNGDYDWQPDFAPEQSDLSFRSKVAAYRGEQIWSKAHEANLKAAA